MATLAAKEFYDKKVGDFFFSVEVSLFFVGSLRAEPGTDLRSQEHPGL